jgi:glycosyltransferase involved in cell wall biosynthesis
MSDLSPILSVIIVAYKSRAEIGPCLASIPRTLGGRRVVVDNFPADGTGDIVCRVPPAHPVHHFEA